MVKRNTTDEKPRKTRLDEFSKRSFAALELVGVLNLAAYWCAVFAGFSPEPDVAVTGIVELIAPYIGYCALQLGLKTSLNKNRLKIGADGSVEGIGAADSDERPVSETSGTDETEHSGGDT
jgi:hypothetical protein